MSTIKIYTQKRRFPIAQDLYGLFFEDINRSGDSGLYPEQLRNRSFEDSVVPERCILDEDGSFFTTPTGWRCEFNNGEGLKRWTKNLAPTDIPAWYSEGNTTLSLNEEDTLNDKRLRSLDIRFDGAGSAYNVGYAGINAKVGKAFRFYMFAKGISGDTRLTVSIKGEDGTAYDSAEIEVKEGGFRRYDCTLTPSSTDRKARLHLSSAVPCSIRLGFISLMPADTYMGRENGLRREVVEMLKGLHPKFMRFPGGCIVEGYSKENATRFSHMIGPVWERPSNYLLWFYRTTNGFGYHEYLQLCEDLGMSAMYVANCGLTCQGRKTDFFEGDELEDMFQECVQAIEYATAPVGTKWGDMRAAAGHPEPFDLKYLEIGNENYDEVYNVRYKMFYERLKKLYPQLIYISNCHTERDGLPTEVVDEHFYSDLEFFVSHHNYYDHYDRKGPQIFVGEYAVTVGENMCSLGAALGEAAFLTGVERNQDIVSLTSYAPMMLNEDYMSWIPDLIVYNNDQVYGIPTYHALKMFAEHRGDTVVELETQSEQQLLDYPGMPAIGAAHPGVSFRNVFVNGTPCEEVRNVPGYFQTVGEFHKKADAFVSTSDNAYALADQQFRRDTVLSAEIKFDKENEATLSVWNYKSSGGYKAEDEDSLNYDGMVYYGWSITNGESWVYARKGRRDALTERVPLDIDFSQYNEYKMVTAEKTIQCFVNGKLVHEAPIVSMPYLTASATVDDKAEEVILKLVNISEENLEIPLVFDCEISSTGVAKILTGNGKCAKNTMDAPEAVIPQETLLTNVSSHYHYNAPANSVNILRFSMK